MLKVCILALALSCLSATALANTCGKVNSYKTKLVPACDKNDMPVRWPNHEDLSTFFVCTSVGRAELMKCPYGEIFTHVLQICTNCARFLAPVECEKLRTQKPPVCVPINGGSSSIPPTTSAPASSYPTPNYPTSTPSGGEETESEASPTDDPNAGNPTSESPNSTIEPENPETEETDFPGPPSPQVTGDPTMPTPSTPMPTPPIIDPTPPLIG